MHGVKFCLILGLCLSVSGLALAADEEQKEVVSDMQSTITIKPLTAKKIYREAWNNDNLSKMRTVDKIEYMEKNSSALDEDTKAIMRGGVALMKKMNYGLEDKDITENAEAIQNNPALAVQNLSENLKTSASKAEILSILSDMVEPGQRLMEKMYKDKSLGEITYPVDINAF